MVDSVIMIHNLLCTLLQWIHYVERVYHFIVFAILFFTDKKRRSSIGNSLSCGKFLKFVFNLIIHNRYYFFICFKYLVKFESFASMNALCWRNSFIIISYLLSFYLFSRTKDLNSLFSLFLSFAQFRCLCMMSFMLFECNIKAAVLLVIV